MEKLWQDLRFGLRSLAKRPGLTAIAVLSLGLGIGAVTTAFTWLDRFVLRPLPGVTGFNRLVLVSTRAPDGREWSVSWTDFKDWREGAGTVQLAAFDMNMFGLRVDQGVERVWGQMVSGNYFDVMGVRATLGRMLTLQDEDAAAPVVVLTEGFWRRQFAADSSIIGQPIVLSGQPMTVVGIAAPGFGGAYVGLMLDVFVPATTAPLFGLSPDYLNGRGFMSFNAVGRLARGSGIEQARQETDAIARRAREAAGATVFGALVKPLSEEGAAEVFKPVSLAMLGVTGLVLLIACANVANLLLARAVARRREIAIRCAVGANRMRLVRQLLTESAALAAMAGALGLVLAAWGRNLLYAFIPPAPFPISFTFETDMGVLAFAVAVTAGTALLFGLAPALVASRPELVPNLKDEIGAGSPHRARLQPILVGAQIALSLVTLVSAGLFLRSLGEARRVDVGFTEPERVLLANTSLQLAGISGDSAVRAMTDRLLERVRAVPGVEAASVATLVPLGFGGSSSSSTEIEGYVPSTDENMSVPFSIVGSDYFRTMGIPVLAGRDIGAEDVDGSGLVAVVNEAFVRRYWPGQSVNEVLGRRVRQLGTDWATVVGVVKTGKYFQLKEAANPLVYRPITQAPRRWYTVHMRAAGGDGLAVTASARRAFADVSADLPFLDPRTMAGHMEASTFVMAIGAWMLGGFGLLALALAGIGIYGVMSYSVNQRTREIGVRIALGASGRDVVRMVVTRALKLAAFGLAAGLVVALVAGNLLRSMLLGVSPRDPVTFATIGLVLAAVAAVASWLPARRASRVDPMVALRYE